MATRSLKQAPQSPISLPKNLNEWHQLMKRAITKADQNGDRRIHGLRKAFADGKVERHLRMLGIVSEADLLREFPELA